MKEDKIDNNIEDETTFFFSEETGKSLSIGGLIFIFLAVIAFVIFSDWSFSLSLNEEKVGQFGDFVGGTVGTIFSLAGVILFYIALREQRSDIKINQRSANLQTEALQKQIEEFEKQKEELELTRKVYENQLKSMAEQEKTMKIQQFDSTFYALLNVYISIKNELNKKDNNRNFFKERYLELRDASLALPFDSPLQSHNTITENYLKVFFLFKGELSHYFKTIYRLIKIVDSNILLDEKQKKFYCKILRAQLDDYETQILYYNFHCTYGEKSKVLMYKYNMLKHLHPLSKVVFQIHLGHDCYNQSIIAFCDKVDSFLEHSVNLFCSDFDLDIIEQKIEELSCTIALIYGESLTLRVILFDESQIPKYFRNLFLNIIYDKLYISQFRNIHDGILDIKESRLDESLILNYTLNDKKIGKLNTDNN
ncbi:putative phage abortive infection protein [Sphingobacterium corticibacterium]|uniref:Phage abortive infection protein n=1 Tax=Sphingobacterium corticibacterium TaxID=2484746 RepID=A0A4Q6XMN0_9SPHI|nr:putative phage abortive infection protein [Sphingobacterium corticibacterium]RZF58572.1 hypothetical protein EWE74_18405 [Sphingobacterium corticibacterium]